MASIGKTTSWKPLGEYNMNGKLLTVKENTAITDGNVFEITWLNDYCFHLIGKKNKTQWYYIYTGSGFRAIEHIVGARTVIVKKT
mmetsp:Transcript_25908/g.72544  ORF Transcript_25908/g.72544 Transcript_25908/m.72544 type:complete len:85 (-) Transcript_25908:103-357(-)